MKKRTFLFALFLGLVTVFNLAQAATPSLADQAKALAEKGDTAGLATLAAANPSSAVEITKAAVAAKPALAASIAGAIAKAVPASAASIAAAAASAPGVTKAAATAVITEVSKAVPDSAASIAKAVQTAVPSVSVADAAQAASAGSGKTVDPKDVTGPNTGGGTPTTPTNTPPVDPAVKNISGS